MTSHNGYDPLHRYAFHREADHLWALENVARTLACLRGRWSKVPQELLERWLQWLPRFRDHFHDDADHQSVLEVRGWIAKYTMEVGDEREALRLSSALLPDQERVLGRDHPDTISTLGFFGVLTIDMINKYL